jgi:methyl-accepting chemotaxis protein
LRSTCEGLGAHESALAQQVETTARGLVAIDQASRAVLDRIAQVAGASHDSTTSLADLADVMRSVDGAAESITELSRDLVTRAELGRAKFAESVAGMEAIRIATESAETIVRGLGTQTQEIGGILDVIDDLGDQTSLLALNAAIIAAQAGEHGRSFSVVAEEIRDLADRVLVSTKEIGGLIHAVQKESERAMEAIAAGSISVRDGAALSAEVGRTLDDLTKASRMTSNRVVSISTSVEKQSRLLEQASEQVAQVDAAVREISATGANHLRDHAFVAESLLGVRNCAANLRSLARDQVAGLARIEGELGLARDSARGTTSLLENRAIANRRVADVIEVAGERVRSIGSIGADLAAAHEAIRVEIFALRTRWAQEDVTSRDSSEIARVFGEGS